MIADYGSLNMGQIVSWGNPYHGKVETLQPLQCS